VLIGPVGSKRSHIAGKSNILAPGSVCQKPSAHSSTDGLPRDAPTVSDIQDTV
jgi:hypothetical protein